MSVVRQLSETADQTQTVRPAAGALCVLSAMSAAHAIINREHHHEGCCMAQWVRACVCVCVWVCLCFYPPVTQLVFQTHSGPTFIMIIIIIVALQATDSRRRIEPGKHCWSAVVIISYHDIKCSLSHIRAVSQSRTSLMYEMLIM